MTNGQHRHALFGQGRAAISTNTLLDATITVENFLELWDVDDATQQQFEKNCCTSLVMSKVWISIRL
jgi:hypothetical protein